MNRTASPLPGRVLAAWAALAGADLRLALRRGENLVVTIALPAAVLVFLALVPLGPASAGGVSGLVPRVLATAVVATGLVSLGITTAFERSDGALRRLVLSPAPVPAIIGARTTAVAVTVAAQAVLLAAIALALGWRPDPAALLAAVPALLAGTAAHAAAGLALAFRFRAEAVLALANAAFVVLLLAGGLIVPAAALPPPVAALAAVLPPGLLASALDAAFAGRSAVSDWLGLMAWAVVLGGVAVLAIRRGEP